MKNLIFLFFALSVNLAAAQEIAAPAMTQLQYEEALALAQEEDKHLMLYFGRSPEFLEQLITNDTLQVLIDKEFISLYNLPGKKKRSLKKQYDAKNTVALLLDKNEELKLKVKSEDVSNIIEKFRPYTETTYRYFTDEFKKEFTKTDSSTIHNAIQTVYEKTSRNNARQLTIAYLKEQKTLLSPINYQLTKTLMPIGDSVLIKQFISELKPEMYTQEMAEKVAFDLLIMNDLSVEKTKGQIASYNIPFQKEVDLYLDVAMSSSLKERKENCYDYVLQANTYDYATLRYCFSYILRNGNQKQIKKVEERYMFTLNDGTVQRSLIFADLLGELYLSRGDKKTFLILKKRNENIREKFNLNF